MAKKEITYKGFSSDELLKMDISEFMKHIPSRARRSLKRGLTDQEKKLLIKVKAFREGKLKKNIKTHCRDMVIIPQFLGLTISIHNGREYLPLEINTEMLGKFLGEFAHTRKKVAHNAPGIGATKSSGAMSVK